MVCENDPKKPRNAAFKNLVKPENRKSDTMKIV